MDKLKKLFVSPARMYGWSAVCFLVFLFIGIPIVNFGRKGQLPFSLFLLTFAVYAVTLFLISIFTTIIYRQWFKKYWYVNIIVGFGSGYFIDVYLLSGLLTSG